MIHPDSSSIEHGRNKKGEGNAAEERGCNTKGVNLPPSEHTLEKNASATRKGSYFHRAAILRRRTWLQHERRGQSCTERAETLQKNAAATRKGSILHRASILTYALEDCGCNFHRPSTALGKRSGLMLMLLWAPTSRTEDLMLLKPP